MSKKVLLLGSSGKMGIALREMLGRNYIIVGKNSADFDAADFKQVRSLVEQSNPNIVINTAAYIGIDPCEKDPENALRLNTLYPRVLAELSNEFGFLLVHFSTDAVFNDRKEGFYTEKDSSHPLNIYGFTKYGGDCFVQAIAKRYYIFRISVLFGETAKNTQFVEKMLQKIKEGQRVLNISADIIGSPSYSKDIAGQIKEMLNELPEFGLYHIANEGKASLYDLMKEIVQNLSLDVEVKKASYKDFPFLGIKNAYTPIKSEKIASLRLWQDAVKEYCGLLRTNGGLI